MYTLYYAPGSCALSPHITLTEAGIPHTLVKVDLATHTTEDGTDYYTINPKGYVPALTLPDGQILTEGVAIVQYLADQAKESGLAPENGTMARYRLQEWLTFISAEVHKTFSPLWNQSISPDARTAAVEKLHKRFPVIEEALASHAFITGDKFTVADAYAFTVLNWSHMLGVDLAAYPHIRTYLETVGARPHVQEALKAQGLL
jgi:glutathione S-transferase